MTIRSIALTSIFFCSSLAVAGGASISNATSNEEMVASIVQRGALIAHVRVAGEVKFGRQATHFVEVLDSVRGPQAGQLAIVSLSSLDSEQQDKPLKWKAGQQLLLVAERGEDGFYRPTPLTCANDDTEQLRALVPLHLTPTIANAIAQLRNECQLREVEVTVRLNHDDVRDYESGEPLRVGISIRNVGGEDFQLENHIEYDFRYPYFADREVALKQLRDDSSASPVKLFAQRLGRLHALAECAERAERLSNHLLIAPGRQAIATYDLSDEYHIDGGGRFLIWAEVGAHRSPPVVLDLPESLLEERLAEAVELASDDGGPFEIAPIIRSKTGSMPAVGPTVRGDAINAALAYWFRENRRVDDGVEVAILRTINIPAESVPNISGVQLAFSDLQWHEDGEATPLQTSQGQAAFRWRTIEIRSVGVYGNQATVEISESDRHHSGGSGGTISLRRMDGRWKVFGPMRIWKS